MYLTGFADEASKGIEGQIRATHELGWTCIESRNVDGKNLTDLPDDEFDRVCERLAQAEVQVNCLGSAIANWGKRIEDSNEASLAEAKRAIPRMQRLGTRLIRIMSYAVRPVADQMEAERFRRLRELVAMFRDHGLTPVHENCMNYGGMSAEHTLRLLDNVPGLGLVFDTGNPVSSDDFSRPPPYPKQSSWEFFSRIRDHVRYVHIKDGIWDAASGKVGYTFPGAGQGDVRRVVKDLLLRGYDGGFSIEPHMAVVLHDASRQSPEEIQYANYVEYGRRMERLIAEIRAEIART